MLRRLIAFQIFILALAFAFAALTAMRWPSLMLLANLFLADTQMAGLDKVDWRLIGLAHGGAWMLAAFCFYAAALTLAGRRKGSLIWYVFGLAASLPCLVMLKTVPTGLAAIPALDGVIFGGAVAALLLLAAVWELRLRPAPEIASEEPAPKPEPEPETEPEPERAIISDDADDTAIIVRRRGVASPTPAAEAPRRKSPVPPAIQRQRESFARHGRKMRTRQLAR